MLASVVMATAVVGVGGALAAAHQHNAAIREQGSLLQAARSLMEEVATVPFAPVGVPTSNGWAGGDTDRHEYDEVFDFDGYAETAPFESLQPKGDRLAVGTGFSRSVSVTPMSAPGGLTAARATAPFALVEVTARAPNGRTVTLRRWVSRTPLVR
jgi:hypothetical protein